jgi:hypothetical protein
MLSSLAMSSLKDLHYSLPVLRDDIQLVDTLGCGLSGIVYEGSFKQKPVVVKVHCDQQRMSREIANLTVLQDNN